jgi:hypothetical protein
LNMRKLVAVALFVLSCGGGEELSPRGACNQLQDVQCDKVFACYSQEILDASTSTFGRNAAECKVKFRASECSIEKTMCAPGTTFNAPNAAACVADYRQMSCDDFAAPDFMPPASCGRPCI